MIYSIRDRDEVDILRIARSTCWGMGPDFHVILNYLLYLAVVCLLKVTFFFFTIFQKELKDVFFNVKEMKSTNSTFILLVKVTNLSDDTKTGVISKKPNGLPVQHYKLGQTLAVCFPKDLDVKFKAVLIGLVLYLVR